MPANKKGGKGFKRAKKNSFQSPTFEIAQDGQNYAKIKKKLGDRRFEIILHGTQEKAVGRARGSLTGWHNMKQDDIVLISCRDFRNNANETFVQDTYDIISFYLPDQVKKLIKLGQITDPTFDNGDSGNNGRELEFFDEEEEEEDQIVQQRTYDMPSSDEDSDVDVDNV